MAGIKIVVDNREKVMHALYSQMKEASEEIKETVLDSVLWQMLHGYNEPHGEDGHTEIYDTGRLYESMNAKVDEVFNSGFGITLSNNKSFRITVSTDTEYASYVHNGTTRLKGRPFITDGINRQTYNIEQS